MIEVEQMRSTWDIDATRATVEIVRSDSENDVTFHDYMVVDGQPNDRDPRVYAEKVLDFEEHQDIRNGGANIDWLFRTSEKIKAGRRILGMCYAKPKVQGDLSPLFDDLLTRLLGRIPDFLIVLDLAYWDEATPLQREILVHHELLHASQAKDLFGAPRFDRDGLPVWALRAHDLEEFNDVVRRYGVHSEDVEAFLHAITENMEAAAP
jgi:hypothetical protein